MIPEIITQSWIEDQIDKTEYKFDPTDNKKWCICICTLKNGFVVCAESYRQFSVQHAPLPARSRAYSKVIDKLYGYFAFLSHWQYHE